jgi:hypothetical protein
MGISNSGVAMIMALFVAPIRVKCICIVGFLYRGCGIGRRLGLLTGGVPINLVVLIWEKRCRGCGGLVEKTFGVLYL